MLLHSCLSLLSSPKTTLLPHPNNHYSFRNPKFICTCRVGVGVGVEDIAEILHNKVLIAAGVSAAVGQLSKPFTSYLIYGKPFQLKTTLQAGGLPSTHSSKSVVAAATCLALERGFSDSIFGLTVVYAGLIMYDAQGVRREVGIHAKALNEVVAKTESWINNNNNNNNNSNEESKVVSMERGVGAGPRPSLLLTTPKTDNEKNKKRKMGFKESIGHTEVEVVAGALLGFFVSLAVNAIL